MRGGQSVDTIMGFTPLDGLMMGTRRGAIDPGILLYLQRERGMSTDEPRANFSTTSPAYWDLGYFRRHAFASVEQRSTSQAEAIELFTFEVAKAVCGMAFTLGGIDCLVFTGGIGEHAAKVRAMICTRLRWLGSNSIPKQTTKVSTLSASIS